MSEMCEAKWRFQSRLVIAVVTLLMLACSPDRDGKVDSQAEAPGQVSPQKETPKANATAAAVTQPEVEQPDQPEVHTNRLVDETSPYLRMHAHNPVNWYPWGEEAFKKAKEENKPVFLSIGYSSCYWCHVMERESFMDNEIARFLNEHFVCIKVDREERPDVDSIYMIAVQLINKRGGWPMSVFMTPAGEPFFGGTYFPARDGDRRGAPGFLTLISQIRDAWQTKREAIDGDAKNLTALIRSQLRGQLPEANVELSAAMVDNTQQAMKAEFDEEYGGFGYSVADPYRPKFPEPSNLVFLLERVRTADDEDSRRMLLTSLEKMHLGGIWDHMGGGFHRYSVDRFWRIPHFEKMLYDNGQLLAVYSQAYQLTQREDFRRVVDETVKYLNREMKDPGGAYRAAMDAESEKVEGKFYRWQPAEVRQLLGDDYEFFATVYGLDGEPNFEEEFYVLQLARPLSEIAAEQNVTEAELDERLAPLREKLLAHRNQRPKPLIDDKILCSWNGLLIRGLADAGRWTENAEYVASASEAADFVLANLRDENGRLLRTYSQGQAKLNAYLDDYAFLADGLIALHQATGEQKWLDEAQRLTDLQIELFWDEEGGGFFFTSKDHEALIARVKQLTDGAQPAGNSVAANNLLYLAEQLNDDKYRQHAQRTAQGSAVMFESYPAIAPQATVAVDRLFAEGG